FIDLGTLPGYQRSIALSVNDAGTVVGYCPFQDSTHTQRAFVWRGGVMTALQNMVPPGLIRFMGAANGINQNGQIVGTVRLLNNTSAAALLTPVPGLPGDVNCDRRINMDDLLIVINQWGPNGPLGSLADLNEDGVVDAQDLAMVLLNWSP